MVSYIKLAVVCPFAKKGALADRGSFGIKPRGKRGMRMKKRLLCFLLTGALLLGLLAGAAPAAQAATKQQKSRAIAVVFDNSGSMYIDRNTMGWCRATYAMEVFAAMMNDGDQLLIYPMWPIQLGKTGSSMTSLTINGPDEASKIREIYTPFANGTPFAAAKDAYAGLMAANADEKYLIILTDGVFDTPTYQVSEFLDDYAKEVNVMFLGIGGSAQLPQVSDSTRQYYDKAATSEDVLAKLSAMCNRIFGRDELACKNNQITFDVSMNKIIVFVQGEGIDNVSLSGGIKVSEHATKYSELGRGGPFGIDTSLQGMLVTYESLDAGTYDISYTGNADNVCVYYEPDVDLSIQLVDADGVVHDTGDDLPAGSYRLEYGLVDKYGVPTTSDLLGNQNYDLTYIIDGTPYAVADDNSGSVELTLNEGSILDGEFTVQYLNDYTIRKNGDSLGWPPGGWEVTPAILGDITLQVTGGASTYNLSTLEQDAVYSVSILYKGAPLTGEELKNTMLDVDLAGGNATTKLELSDSGYTVSVRYNGDAPNTSCGEYTLTLCATYTLNGTDGQSNEETRPFTVVDDSTALAAQLELPQTFYEIPKLAESSPIYLNLTMGGAPMDSHTFAGTLVTVDIPGVEVELQPDAAASRYIIILKPGNIEGGKYTVTANVSAFDQIGRAVTAQDTAKIELQPYPSWLPILIYILIALLILILIWLYLNAKILPKHIGLGSCTFIVDGDIVTGSAKCVYTGKNKRRGTLSVQSPHYGANPAAKCGYTLELEAVSPRRTRSRARSARVVGIRPLSAASTIAVQVGGCNMSRDPATGKLMKVGGKPGAPISFNVGNNARTSVTAEVMDMTNGGGEITVSMSVPLKFL